MISARPKLSTSNATGRRRTRLADGRRTSRRAAPASSRALIVDQLDLLDPAGQDRPRRDGEEAVRIDPEQDLRELQYDGSRVTGDDDQPAEASDHPPGGIREEHVQEHRRRHQVEQVTDGEQQRARSTTAGRSGPSRIRWRSSADRAGSPAGATTRWSR